MQISRYEQYCKDKEKSHIYIMDLIEGQLYIDAAVSGNFSRYYSSLYINRFINHSCEPNCIIDKWNSDDMDIKIYIRAIRDIMIGEEFTIDYGFTSSNCSKECYCGSQKCRGIL